MLRIEVIVHNMKAHRWGRSLPTFPEIVGKLKGILERFLDAVRPAQIGQTKVGGIDLNQPRMRRAAEAVLALSASPAELVSRPRNWPVRSMLLRACRNPNMEPGALLLH